MENSFYEPGRCPRCGCENIKETNRMAKGWKITCRGCGYTIKGDSIIELTGRWSSSANKKPEVTVVENARWPVAWFTKNDAIRLSQLQ